MSGATKPKPLSKARVYDKNLPGDRQTVAYAQSAIDDDGKGVVLFVCQQYEGGVSFLNKQHAIEFASCLLMVALGLPGDVPAGDCGLVEREHDSHEEP